MTKTAKFDSARERLSAKRAELISTLRAEAREPALEQEPVPEEDRAASFRDAAVEARLNDLDFEELLMVDAALERLDSGAYGKCLDCGHSIGTERLRALPWASRCIGCERRTASHTGSPAFNDRTP